MTAYVGTKVNLYKNISTYKKQCENKTVVAKYLTDSGLRYDVGDDGIPTRFNIQQDLLSYAEDIEQIKPTEFDCGEYVKVFSKTYNGYVYGIVSKIRYFRGEIRYTVIFNLSDVQPEDNLKHDLAKPDILTPIPGTMHFKFKYPYVLHDIPVTDLHKIETRTEVFPIMKEDS